MSEKTRVRHQFDIQPHVGRKLDDVERDLIMGTLAVLKPFTNKCKSHIPDNFR